MTATLRARAARLESDARYWRLAGQDGRAQDAEAEAKWLRNLATQTERMAL